LNAPTGGWSSRTPDLQPLIEDTLRRLAANPADPRLKTHRLSGQLAGLMASSVAYDCRIIFARGKHPKTRAEVLTLLNIGSHDEVY